MTTCKIANCEGTMATKIISIDRELIDRLAWDPNKLTLVSHVLIQIKNNGEISKIAHEAPTLWLVGHVWTSLIIPRMLSNKTF